MSCRQASGFSWNAHGAPTPQNNSTQACPLRTDSTPSYGLSVLLLRAGIHAMRRLIPSMDPEEKQAMLLSKRLMSLLGKKPNKSNGRLMYFKHLCENLKKTHDNLGRQMPLGTYQTLMARHGQRWAALSEAQRANWGRAADAYKSVKALKGQAAIDECLELLRMAHRRVR